jgi:hypothetical protein
MTTWAAEPAKREATNEHGYKITWADGPNGRAYYNAYSPQGKHIDSGFDKEIVKAMCEVHREKLAKDRAAYRAKKLARA